MKNFNRMNDFRTTHSFIQEKNNDPSRTERGRQLNVEKLLHY